MKFPTRNEYQERLLARMPEELRAKAEKDFAEDRKFSAVKLEGGKTLKLSFMDFIGDWWLGTTSHDVSAALKEAGDVDHIIAEINSYGGFAHEGMGIFNLLRNHPAKVTTNVIGVAYSAASVIAAAGDEREMGVGSLQMIHNALTCTCGNAADLREAADYLEKMSEGIAEIYAEVTGLPVSEVQEMMDAESYLNVKDCLDKGFATKKSASGSSGSAAKNLGRPAQLELGAPPQRQSFPAAAVVTNQGRRLVATQAKAEKKMSDNDAFEKAVQAKAEAEAKTKTLEETIAANSKEIAQAKERAELAEKSLAAVLKAAGAESADAAVGTIATALEARDKLLPEAQNRIKELEKANEDGEAAELLNKLKAENRISPAQEKDLWPSLSLEGKKSFAKTAPPINGTKLRESEDSGSAKGAVLPTWNGKNYNELTFSQKADLKKADEKLWAEMKASVEAN